MRSRSLILLIEAHPDESELFSAALTQSGMDVSVLHAHDAEAALQFMTDSPSHDPLPSLILLAWDSEDTGRANLTRLKQAHELAPIPIVVVGISRLSQDVTASYRFGANSYVVKPRDFDGLMAMSGAICRFWLKWNVCTTRGQSSTSPASFGSH